MGGLRRGARAASACAAPPPRGGRAPRARRRGRFPLSARRTTCGAGRIVERRGRRARRARPRRASRGRAAADPTPEGTPRRCSLLARRARAARCGCACGCPCCRTARPAGCRAIALGAYNVVRTHLIVDRRRLRARLGAAGGPCSARAIGIGRRRWPTPAGTFCVRNRLTRLHRSGLRPARVRHQRPLRGAHRLARRRLHRHPRHESTRAAPRPRLARLHPHAQPRHPRLDRLMPVGTPVTIR